MHRKREARKMLEGAAGAGSQVEIETKLPQKYNVLDSCSGVPCRKHSQ